MAVAAGSDSEGRRRVRWQFRGRPGNGRTGGESRTVRVAHPPCGIRLLEATEYPYQGSHVRVSSA